MWFFLSIHKNFQLSIPCIKNYKNILFSFYRAWLSSLYLRLQMKWRMKVSTGRSWASAFYGVHAYGHWAIIELYHTLFWMSKTALRLRSLASTTDEFATDLIHIYIFLFTITIIKNKYFFFIWKLLGKIIMQAFYWRLKAQKVFLQFLLMNFFLLKKFLNLNLIKEKLEKSSADKR